LKLHSTQVINKIRVIRTKPARISAIGPSAAEPPDDADGEGERDFYSHLYSGDMTSMEAGAVPEDYYNYLESWYRAQKGLNSGSGVPGSVSVTSSSVSSASAVTASIYIPVDALQVRKLEKLLQRLHYKDYSTLQ
jgi:hypothetical protein